MSSQRVVNIITNTGFHANKRDKFTNNISEISFALLLFATAALSYWKENVIIIFYFLLLFTIAVLIIQRTSIDKEHSIRTLKIFYLVMLLSMIMVTIIELSQNLSTIAYKDIALEYDGQVYFKRSILFSHDLSITAKSVYNLGYADPAFIFIATWISRINSLFGNSTTLPVRIIGMFIGVIPCLLLYRLLYKQKNANAYKISLLYALLVVPTLFACLYLRDVYIYSINFIIFYLVVRVHKKPTVFRIALILLFLIVLYQFRSASVVISITGIALTFATRLKRPGVIFVSLCLFLAFFFLEYRYGIINEMLKFSLSKSHSILSSDLEVASHNSLGAKVLRLPFPFNMISIAYALIIPFPAYAELLTNKFNFVWVVHCVAALQWQFLTFFLLASLLTKTKKILQHENRFYFEYFIVILISIAHSSLTFRHVYYSYVYIFPILFLSLDNKAKTFSKGLLWLSFLFVLYFALKKYV
jgi:hypothetical protein